ncbi:hypothetical protein BH24ACT26_BH24ACT26_21430 [soil metagenome]
MGDWAVSIADPVARFERELTAVGGLFHRAPPETLGDVFGAVLDGRSGARVLVARENGVPAEVDEAIAAAGGEVVRWPDAGTAAAAEADVGVTSALWAVAETGSIVVSSALPGGRAPSLLPPVHVAFVPVERLVATTRSLFSRMAALEPRPSATVIVTGPSKSADIGMELTLGVHGPGEVHVVLLGRKLEPSGAS